MSERPTLILDLNAAELLKAFLGLRDGVQQWNDLMGELDATGLIGRVWSDEADEPGIVMGLSMEGADFSGLAMAGIHLGPVYMNGCRFDRCDLRGAVLAICPGCSFHEADLRGAMFAPVADLTSAYFMHASTDTSTLIERGLYDGHPPKGLPGRLLARCKADPPDAREPPGRTNTVPIRVDAGLYIPTAFH
jgi:uncharacterized protein YjbI with pentapeptide repeats